ncbi:MULTISPECIES: 23S rRNA (adenine(2503)-C(2))-methyltransferase RlmN [Enterococcaceae]|uniref:23S rRNA (adenine(2503)-C(2))-methyltransferase RlmN n=1 Tax=Enterococcaceae TaxID=81852 RepID=UPI000E49022D|nr:MULTISPECIES: 23S rRNA (adenine(2503)-C(2))-methyltransferase RlmN [Enterococcaceae]MCI0129652.1 23S rRNA (adenine(2503)-C(2))-methyltransferase RlmN [Vagococcus sp. CY53-2]RGI31816.1 23S rRNA (adenine(2503)-C(2))-methyltransferase RlmN [Melissococcus sp. OM08-11BH]UNM90494.1 23S rRNA (adenine(2503)-C(2))-methyltransferase RlmN [Vagococcus sp. CY52-2]
MMKPSIYDFTQPQLVDWFVKNGEKKFRAAQVWQWLYEKRVTDFSEMSNLSKQTIELLKEHFVLDPLKEVVVQEGQDGTIKYLFELPDHHMIETVLMRQAYGLSVCVTTQIGCNIGCTFCASGLLKKQRNLTTGEIVAQIMKVQHYLDKQGQGERVSHIVVMGIGEPFDNYNNVMNFLHIMNDPKGLQIGARHMTVSTSGLVPKIKEFATNGLQVNLAISLHAPNNDTRTSIMQINRAYPLERLMDAVDYYLKETNRRITFEYIMLQGVNDTPEHAQQLADLLKDKKKLTYVNLIPYNTVEEHDLYQRSTKKDTLAFYDILKKNGINCVVRQEFGSDIDAACGQLRSKQMRKEKSK